MKKRSSLAALAFVVVSMFGFYQCTNDEELFDGFPHEWEYQSLDQIHQELSLSDTIQFTINDPSIDNLLEGPKGTQLFFPAGSFGTGNLPLPITVKMIEIYKRGEMIRHNMQTFNQASPMVSAGAIWLSFEAADGTPLSPTGGQTTMPYKTDANGYQNDMKYVAGSIQMAPSGAVNSWVSTTANVTFDSNAGLSGEFTIDDMRQDWTGLGADQAIEEEDKTQISVSIPNVSDLIYGQAYFVSNDFTIVAALTNVVEGKLASNPASIEKGMEGKIIAIGIVDGKIHFAQQDVVVAGDDQFVVNISQGTLNELAVLLNSLN